MKRLPIYPNVLAFLCLIGFQVMIVNVISIKAEHQWSTAEQLLNVKEEELRTFVRAVEANSRNCSAVSGCSNSGGSCSRLSCYKYGIPDDSNYRCVGIANNSEFCGPQCKERNFDYSKAFVRVVDKDSTRTARTVCTHRTLDNYFKNSSMNDSTHLFRVYFGAVDGTFRIYPGADEKCDSPYDPRVRPWYLQSSFVPKVVIVLLDSGLMMRSPITHSNETYLDKAVNTALKFLKTLREGIDFVNIMCFDGDGNLRTPNSTPVKYNQTLQDQNFSDSLADIVNNNSVVTDPSALHTSNAINTAIIHLNNSIPIQIPEGYLKVVIVLTSGLQFKTLSELNILANSGVNLFVYNFRTPNQAPECNSAIRASSEGIPEERIDNPLYALESYYSFLGKIHKIFYGDTIDYSPPYRDYTGIDVNTLTVSKAAFGPSGELLGTVGIDIFQTRVDEQFPSITFQSVVDATKARDPQYSKVFNTSKDLTTGVCFNHTDACGPGLNDTRIESGLCQVETNGDARIGCCGRCKSKTEWAKIVGGAVAGAVGLILVIAVIVYLARRCVVRRRAAEKVLVESQRFTFPGPENDKIVLPGETTGVNFGLKAPGY
ncbi:hypothetical protein KC19_1G259900 [Ceratodon purpureus]|uniref:VWFA domain-containing protein n=1 Tax=Ceratodon purpureus TaxID=3225 RepID=A0A8T0J9W3_CERPU|nr:hypothetical protein KC19_1G259900 [Ceratodon purpureus]